MSVALYNYMASMGPWVLNVIGNEFASGYHSVVPAKVDPEGKYLKLPVEIHGEIFSHLDNTQDITNLRLACKYLAVCGRQALLNMITDNRVIVPRYESLLFCLSLVAKNRVSAKAVRRVELVAETFKKPEYGHDWGWEYTKNKENVINVTQTDMVKIRNINIAHAWAVAENNAFICTGTYQELLYMFLELLPNLETVIVRKLRPGEHIPGWDGPELIKELSFYKNNLDTNRLFYGDWQYDETHHCEIEVDEFGDDIVHPHAGKKATFKDDLVAAVDATCGRDKLVFID